MKKQFNFENKKFLKLLENFNEKEKSLITKYLKEDYDDLYWTCAQEYEFDGDFYQPIKDLVLNMDDENYDCPFLDEEGCYSFKAESLILLIYDIIEKDLKTNKKNK